MALQGSAEILLLALIKDIKGLERHRAPGMMCSLLTPPEIPLSLSHSLSLSSLPSPSLFSLSSLLCCCSLDSFLLTLNHHLPPFPPPTPTLTLTSFPFPLKYVSFPRSSLRILYFSPSLLPSVSASLSSPLERLLLPCLRLAARCDL